GTVVGFDRGQMLVDVTRPIEIGDGLGFEDPAAGGGATKGFTVTAVRTLSLRNGIRQSIEATMRIPAGWRVTRTSSASVTERARATFANQPAAGPSLTRVDVRLFGHAGSRLKAVFEAGGEQATASTEKTLAPASKRALDSAMLREQLGRLGG